jgi:nucleotide-binding universal stress UspA family protein
VIQRILCPVDFSDASRHAVEHAIALARWYGAAITGLHVYTPMVAATANVPAPDDRLLPSELTRVRETTEAWFGEAVTAGLKVDVVVDVGLPAGGILSCAEAVRPQMIVMGTHGATGFEHLLLGSVAEKVLRKAPCPVLTVPPRATATSMLPFKRLLCAIDFSDPSTTALELAQSLAIESRAQLLLLHVIEWPWHEPPSPALDELPREQAAALAEYRRYLEAGARTRLHALGATEGSASSEPALKIAHGKAYSEILRTAQEDSADLIVMGVHGRNILDMTLFGSTTNHVVRAARCPVLTVRR